MWLWSHVVLLECVGTQWDHVAIRLIMISFFKKVCLVIFERNCLLNQKCCTNDIKTCGVEVKEIIQKDLFSKVYQTWLLDINMDYHDNHRNWKYSVSAVINAWMKAHQIIKHADMFRAKDSKNSANLCQLV